jgi:hypothetical protein
MKRRAVLVMAGAVVALTGMPQRTSAQSVSACNGANCIQVNLTNPAAGQMGLTFQQAPNDGQAGGPDEIAAIALTISFKGNPLTLNGCQLNADGLPSAVVPDPSISNFKVVVENASCANGRTHCLCPDQGSGITPDNFINLVIYGPNPLPTPGPNPVNIPTLPAGPQQLLTIALTSSSSGTFPLHIYDQVDDSGGHPPFTALLSAGDKVAVDQTCVPVAGQPPCSGSATSQVATTDTSITIAANVCIGDCDGSGDVGVNEIIILVNMALGNQTQLSACPHGLPASITDPSQVDVTLIIKAVSSALNGCQLVS